VGGGVAATLDEEQSLGIGVQVPRTAEELDSGHRVELLRGQHQRHGLSTGGKLRQPAQSRRGRRFGLHAVVTAEAPAHIVRELLQPRPVRVDEQQDGSADHVPHLAPGSTHRPQRSDRPPAAAATAG
jgi:hypothetical protein